MSASIHAAQSAGNVRRTWLASIAIWAVPSLLALVLYQYGLRSWFAEDDFAWLNLRHTIHNSTEFWRAMFQPLAQGTIRPLSERGFFMLFEALFGVNALPYHAWVFLNHVVNLALLASIVRRLLHSAGAALAAGLLWTVSGGMATPLSWLSSYNQVLLACTLLAGLRWWMLYLETRRERYYVLQWAAFIAGFGVLELNVVFPAIAAAYALCTRKPWLIRLLPMFAASAAFTIVHFRIAPPPEAGPYRMHYDLYVFSTLRQYAADALGPGLSDHGWLHSAAWIALGAMVAYVVWTASKRRLVPLFGVAWFLMTLGPLVPLRDHISVYYLYVPAIGVAIVLATAVMDAVRRGPVFRLVVAGAILLYCCTSVPYSLRWTRWHYGLSKAVEHTWLGVLSEHQAHPGALIAIENMPTDVFWGSWPDSAPLWLGIRDVYLTPAAAARIDRIAPTPDPAAFVVPQVVLAHALAQHAAIVLDVSKNSVHEDTAAYARSLRSVDQYALPSSIKIGSPSYAFTLGSGWYASEGAYRWMSRHAEAFLDSPSANAELYVDGYAPGAALAGGPVTISARVNGANAGQFTVSKAGPFEGRLHAPPVLGRMAVDLTCHHGFRPPSDGRELCLAITSITAR